MEEKVITDTPCRAPSDKSKLLHQFCIDILSILVGW